MSKRPSLLTVVAKASLAGLLTYGLYKLTVPKEEDIKKVISTNSSLEQEEWHKLMTLSANGYSFEAATAIIRMEKKKKYEKKYAEEAAKRLKELEEKKRREAPLLNVPGALDLACEQLLGRPRGH